MLTKSFVVLLSVLLGGAYCTGVSPCPIANHNGTVYSGIDV